MRLITCGAPDASSGFISTHSVNSAAIELLAKAQMIILLSIQPCHRLISKGSPRNNLLDPLLLGSKKVKKKKQEDVRQLNRWDYSSALPQICFMNK